MEISNERILEILLDVNFWKKEPDIGKERSNYLQEFKSLVSTGQVVTITGPRRSGKSTLMQQMIKKLIENGVERKATLYVNFEDPRFYGLLNLHLFERIYETYLEYFEPADRQFLFFDEVHNIPGWEKFIRYLQDKKKTVIFVSGSSSKLLSAEFGTVLTGRHINKEVWPLSFKEFLTFKNITIKDKMDLLTFKTRIKSLFREYLEYGGFPRVTLSPQKKEEILTNYFNDILSRDIVERYRIKNVDKLKNLAQFYLTNVASPITFNSIKNFLSLPVDTVERFSYYLNYCYLVFFLERFSFSIKEQIKSPRKIYVIDNGLINSMSSSFSKDIGKIMENTVYLDLLHKGKEVFYWKDQQQREVDFIVREKRKVCEIMQVCYDISSINTRRREETALLYALEKLMVKRGFIINENVEREEKKGRFQIIYVPLWKYLLT